MSGVSQVEVVEDDDGVRVDRWFKRHYPMLARGRLEKLLRKGQIRVDGGRVKTNTRLEAGQSVRVPPFGAENILREMPKKVSKPTYSKEDAAFVQSLVLYKDASLIVLNKPSGLAVQGGTKTERHLDGMLDGLKFDLPDRPRLVHRLDRDTSGVLLLARASAAATKLGRSFKERDTRKVYWALTVGVPRPDRGTIRMSLAKQPGRMGERVVPVPDRTLGAQFSETHFATVARAGQKLAWMHLCLLRGVHTNFGFMQLRLCSVRWLVMGSTGDLRRTLVGKCLLVFTCMHVPSRFHTQRGDGFPFRHPCRLTWWKAGTFSGLI